MALLAASLAGCTPKKAEQQIEAGNIRVVATGRSDGAEEVRAIIERTRPYVDSIKKPVVGEAATTLKAYLPESPLMNFAADALMAMAQRYSGEKVDIALTNIGGLRSDLNAGTITFGDVYNVFNFDNRLTLLTLNGEQLMQLCNEIAAAGGQAISGMKMTITKERKLVDATVGGKAIEPQATYRIATLDYLAQGNDKLTTLALGSDVDMTKHLLRDLMVEYIKELAGRGEKVDAECDGRITIKE